jgi:ribonuclease-3
MGQGGRDLESRLGYRFRDPGLLAQALTPPSSGLAPNNQRLEFLGDALLNAAVARILHREKPHWHEGHLSKLRASLVSTASLVAWAGALGLELVTGPRSPRGAPGGKALADAVEALLAAVMEDAGAGGFDAVERICEARFVEPIRRAEPEDWRRRDAKTALQEKAAAQGLPAPRYRLLEQSGPGHAPIFSVEAEVGDYAAQGRGPSRKAAEGEAARMLLDLLEAPKAS